MKTVLAETAEPPIQAMNEAIKTFFRRPWSHAQLKVSQLQLFITEDDDNVAIVVNNDQKFSNQNILITFHVTPVSEAPTQL